MNEARTAGTWTGVGIVLAETLGFHPIGMAIGAVIAIGARRIGREKANPRG